MSLPLSAEPVRPIPSRIGWLQVSDFHVRAAGDPLSQTVAIDALIRDVSQQRVNRSRPSIVLITGDVAFSGRVDEYEAARPFFSRLADAADVPPASFYFVPGNHDVDRTKHRLAFAGACAELTSEADVDRVLGGEDASPLCERQAAFWDFVESFTAGQSRAPTIQGLGYVSIAAIDRYTIALLGLNSAWMSGRTAEEMQLLLGERQVIEALNLVAAADPMLVLALAHHPIEWMHEWDQGVCRERVLAATDFFHRGHLHQADVTLAGSPASPCLTIAAGSSHSTRFYGNSYNWVELDLGAGRCTVFPHRYDPTTGRYAPGQPLTAPFDLRNPIPATSVDLAAAIATVVPSAEPYAGYLASLLRGDKQDVPVARDDGVDFLAPSVARELIGHEGFRIVDEFLDLRNLVRLYAREVPLADRLITYQEPISSMVSYLDALAAHRPEVAQRVAVGSGASGWATRATRLPHTIAFLEALRAEGDWTMLETQAKPLLSGVDEVASRARRLYVEALMHSDETSKRELAQRMGSELIDEPDATVQDHLLAAATCETAGDDVQAIGVAMAALDRWPNDEALLGYARDLATRTGSRELRLRARPSAGAAS